MYLACIFDLDGTLADSLRDLAEASNHALAAQGYPTHEIERYRYFVGNGIPKLIERVLPQDACTPEILNRTRAIFDTYYEVHRLDHTAPYEGIVPLLDSLHEKGVKLAVVSNKPDVFAKKIVTTLFGDRFHPVFGNRPDVPRKPDPAAALEAATMLGVQPEECLFLGDSGVDMKTAEAAKMTGVGVLWGFRDRDELLENGAKRLLARPEELLELF
ncbi:MAG: HAD family hydrolase [Ethanoligenens sp.]|uniref:HAD family hydrolase n=1 Tax=Ethanoligenens sp. TaxID=2099655 RepID=UPI0039E8E7B6